jgi:hypothetical protein
MWRNPSQSAGIMRQCSIDKTSIIVVVYAVSAYLPCVLGDGFLQVQNLSAGSEDNRPKRGQFS